jgi:hypothetical protein
LDQLQLLVLWMHQIQIRCLAGSCCHYWQKAHQILGEVSSEQEERRSVGPKEVEGLAASGGASLALVEPKVVLAEVLESTGVEADFPPNPKGRDQGGQE